MKMTKTLSRDEYTELETQARQVADSAVVELTKVQEATYEKFQSAEEECRRTYFNVYNVTLDNLLARARGENDA
jgi:hypothetical protein